MVFGYEPTAIKYLEQCKKVTKIITDVRNLPYIPYSGGTYFPDIMAISNTRQLIEVKSTYTFMNGFDSLIYKSAAATKYMKNHGGNFWVFIVDKDSILHKIKNPSCAEDFLSVLQELSPQLATLFQKKGPLQEDKYHQHTTKDGHLYT